jgi:hypothetical protein
MVACKLPLHHNFNIVNASKNRFANQTCFFSPRSGYGEKNRALALFLLKRMMYENYSLKMDMTVKNWLVLSFQSTAVDKVNSCCLTSPDVFRFSNWTRKSFSHMPIINYISINIL